MRGRQASKNESQDQVQTEGDRNPDAAIKMLQDKVEGQNRSRGQITKNIKRKEHETDPRKEVPQKSEPPGKNELLTKAKLTRKERHTEVQLTERLKQPRKHKAGPASTRTTPQATEILLAPHVRGERKKSYQRQTPPKEDSKKSFRGASTSHRKNERKSNHSEEVPEEAESTSKNALLTRDKAARKELTGQDAAPLSGIIESPTQHKKKLWCPQEAGEQDPDLFILSGIECRVSPEAVNRPTVLTSHDRNRFLCFSWVLPLY